MLILNMYGPDTIDSYSLALREAGFDVAEATSAFDALAMIRLHHPAVVVISTPVQEMSLKEFYWRIKSDPATSSTIVLRVAQDVCDFAADGDLASLPEHVGAMTPVGIE